MLYVRWSMMYSDTLYGLERRRKEASGQLPDLVRSGLGVETKNTCISDARHPCLLPLDGAALLGASCGAELLPEDLVEALGVVEVDAEGWGDER